MPDPATTFNSRGSEWRRWDPHIHAPGTLLGNQFPQSWDGYLGRIETAEPPLSVLGVTDYFCIRTYRQARQLKTQGRMPSVALIFPNVELRLDLKTEKAQPLNIHLLFSPDVPNHEAEIEKVLARLECEFQDRPWHCTSQDLLAIGRLIDPKQKDEEALLSAGANQFKVGLAQIRDLFRGDEWVRKNCLVAVAGSSNDGTAGLKNDAYTLMRREIEKFAHIIFAATPSQRTFWLGETPGHDRARIEQEYGALKPCLHGCDAHREEDVGAPDLDRFCWIKGDPTFETLRQAVLEPRERVWVGPQPPSHHVPELALTDVAVSNALWIQPTSLELNPGLVTVIGARGSGKTALVEIIARGAQSPSAGVGESSFLRRAYVPIDLLGKARVTLTWRDGSTSQASLAPSGLEDVEASPQGEVCYLSQQFIDRLCSSGGLAKELRAEMERVIFHATDPTDRLDAESFEDYAAQLLEPIRHRREELQLEMGRLSNEIVVEGSLHDKLPSLRQLLAEFTKKGDQAKKDLAALMPKGATEHAKTLALFEAAHAAVQGRIEKLKKRRQALDDLAAEVRQTRSTTEARRAAEMRKRFAAAELDDVAWGKFSMVFAGDVDTVLSTAKTAVERDIILATDGDPQQPPDLEKTPREAWPLKMLRDKRDEAKKAVGIDADRQKKYEELQKSIEQLETSVRRTTADVERATGADARMRELIKARRGIYASVFGSIAEDEATLGRLYEPLSRELKVATGALSRLEFFVHRRVNVGSWVAVAENDIFDLRRGTRLRGHGALKKEIDARLLPSLSSGTADEVATAMDVFRTEFANDLREMMPTSVLPEQRGKWTQGMAAWLYATDHISIEYGIRYDGTMLEQLSPGTRGIVLLLLYLAIDRHDKRPLIIDQPEENLDPKSVFDELVPHFREARRRRQVIVVTHNANLVVNTDADQVIVATGASVKEGALPSIVYESGSLENPRIRGAVCEVLEGGERAFLERERRYRLHLGESLPEGESSVGSPAAT